MPWVDPTVSFLFPRSFPFMVYVSLYRQSPPIYPFMVTSLMWTFTPVLTQTLFLLFSVVLLTFYSHDITLPLFLIIHLSHDSASCLLIIPTLLLAFVSLRTGLLRVLTHTNSIVVQIPDVTYDVMTTPVYKISECGGVTPQL